MWTIVLSIINAVLSLFGKVSDNDTAKEKAKVAAGKDIVTAQIQAEPELYKTRTEFLRGMWITQWLIAAALIPPIYHAGGVYFDSCPFFVFPSIFPHEVGSWGFVALPGDYPQMQSSLIASLLGINAAMTVGGGFVKTLLVKK